MKIEDLTLKEIREICEEHVCGACPLDTVSSCLLKYTPINWTTEDMEREVINEHTGR